MFPSLSFSFLHFCSVPEVKSDTWLQRLNVSHVSIFIRFNNDPIHLSCTRTPRQTSLFIYTMADNTVWLRRVGSSREAQTGTHGMNNLDEAAGLEQAGPDGGRKLV